MYDIVKGTKITAQWLVAEPVCLPGVQPKVGARIINVHGVVRHLRGDDPVSPTVVELYVEEDGASGLPRHNVCDCHGGLVKVDPKHIMKIGE